MSRQTQSSRSDALRSSSGRRRLRDLTLLVLAILAFQWWQSRDLIQGVAPPLVGLLTDGQPWQLDATAGPYLVHFWASWCPTCRFEQNAIERIATDWPVITIATRDGAADRVAAYLVANDLAMPVLIDEHGHIATAWGVVGVPASFVIDRAGQVRHASKGLSTEMGLRFRLWLAR